MTTRLAYYLGVSYRRKRVDADLKALAVHFRGRVLDVGGGRQRGRFRRPAAARWVVADLAPARGVDVAADIACLPFRDGVFDAVKATEVLEHVPDVVAGLRECRRVLRTGGYLIATAPFLERLHGDPDDYARFSGRLAKIVVKEAVDNQKAFAGRLRGLDQGDVLLEGPNGRMHRLPLHLIARGRLDVEF